MQQAVHWVTPETFPLPDYVRRHSTMPFSASIAHCQHRLECLLSYRLHWSNENLWLRTFPSCGLAVWSESACVFRSLNWLSRQAHWHSHSSQASRECKGFSWQGSRVRFLCGQTNRRVFEGHMADYILASCTAFRPGMTLSEHRHTPSSVTRPSPRAVCYMYSIMLYEPRIPLSKAKRRQRRE